MSTINGVLGPLDTADLGFTLMHEHVAGASAGFWQVWPELFGGREECADVR
jgi:predicted metal-dependent phosphotriesterase family hydrolase